MTVTAQNDPRFARGSGFFEVIGMGATVGALAGYATSWEGIGLWKTHGFLMPKTLWAVIHASGIFPPEYMIPLASGACLGLTLGAIAGYRAGYVPGEVHIRGSQITKDPTAMQHAILEASPPIKGKNTGIQIHPKIQTTEHLEASHTLIVGGSGAGKTTVLWPMINQLIARGDKAIIFSFKGDFEQKIPGRFAMLSPWDDRSAVWVLGRDIRTRLDAEALANTLIPEPEKSDNPMWTNGARSLVTGIISDVQREHGGEWGFAELAKKCAESLADFKVLKEIITRENPVAASLIAGGADSKTTSSFLANISAYLTQVVNLGVAADDLKESAKTKQWSVNDWIAGRVPAVAVLGFRPSAKSISEAWCASLIEQIVLKLEDLPDVSPEKRRVWLILDEVPRLGKIPSITEALEVLRSKGVRIILGCQGIGQIEERYSKTTARSWAMQTATKIFGRISEPEDQRWAAGILGERELERYSSQNTSATGGSSSQGGGYQRVKEHTILPAQLGQIVKVTKSGPRALLTIAGSEQVGLLDWPFQSNPDQRGSREEHQARWVLPRYTRPAWGAVPPKVDIPAPATAGTTKPQQVEELPRPQPLPQIQQQVADQTQPQAQAAEDAPDAGETITDHMIGHALDGLMPGAGMGFELLKVMDELMAAPAGSTPVVRIPQPQQSSGQQEEDEEEDQEDEAEV